jgi:hypothetical protein
VGAARPFFIDQAKRSNCSGYRCILQRPSLITCRHTTCVLLYI